MSSRSLIGILALFLGLVGGTWYLTLLNGSGISAEEIVLAGMIMITASVGLLIVSRQSRNPIGWILIWIAFSSGLFGFSNVYARYALITQPGSIPLGLFFAWVTSWIWVVYAGLVVIYLPLLFPTGRLLSPRWKAVTWSAGGYLVIVAFFNAVRPGIIAGLDSIRNPLGLESAANSFEFIDLITSVLLVPLALASVSSLLIRFSRSRGDERAQLKWFFYVATLFIFYVIYGIISVIGFLPNIPEGVGTYVFPLFLAMFAVAIGIAILKYHLYDIDVIIRKTLVYGALTLFLALIYFSGVTLLGNLFSAISGQHSAISIVISTLAIAALFNPLRKWVQEFIDRRFYRQKYDAEKILESFASKARDEVDVERLSEELQHAVEETMHPVYVFTWLKGAASQTKTTYGGKIEEYS